MGNINTFALQFPEFARFDGPQDIFFYDKFENGINASTTVNAEKWDLLLPGGTLRVVHIDKGASCLQITHTAADPEITHLISSFAFRLDSTGGVIKLDGSTPIRWGFRFYVDDVDDMDWHIGLGIYDDDYTGNDPADQVTCQLVEGSANLLMKVQKSGSNNGSPVLGALTDNTFHRIWCEYIPNAATPSSGLLITYLDGEEVLRQEISTFPDDVPLHIVIESANGAATAFVDYVDYVWFHAIRKDWVAGSE